MKMVTEDYVSFETAKLLKEKGFNINSLMVYNQNGNFMPAGAIEDTYQVFYAAPTLQMVMKWLREVHKIYIEIHLCIDGRCSTFQIASLKDDVVDAWDDAFMPNNISIEDLRFNTYQEAEEAAVKHCLENLI